MVSPTVSPLRVVGFRVQGLGFRVLMVCPMVPPLRVVGFRVQGLGF